ncbi:glutathione S-transferase family protein [Parasphingorhabdus cellanae]|uniref:Glutathione S-transferase family protein n=1 Tax=Parasphingorhabdus cellanae TaxID=2806553 RepID=A0ABX7T6H1_9SPHN|nr:glutathione S-transferase family protein [Parasphingorhabdus cellanae]QTD57121.1 glutathione S-transferase family protein [Parasphingorhabdus cellanae]
MLKLYFAPLTRSIRIKWLLEELEIAHEIVPVAFNRDGDKGFAQHTPAGNFPYIEDGDVALSESGAIVQYILEQYGNGRLEPPVGSLNRASYLHWLHFSEGTAAQPINTTVWLTVYRDDAEKHQAIINAVRGSANHILDKVEQVVSKQAFLAGDQLTGADIMMGFTLWSAKMLGILSDAHPYTVQFLKQLTSRPAFEKALAESRRLQ